jgi:hypothetical protein
MSGVQQLNYCKQLYQATLNCKDQCEKLVPEAFNAALLDALQHLMLLAVQLQQVGRTYGLLCSLQRCYHTYLWADSQQQLSALSIPAPCSMDWLSSLIACWHILLLAEGAAAGCAQLPQSSTAITQQSQQLGPSRGLLCGR